MANPYEVLSKLLVDNLSTVEKLVESDGTEYPYLTKLLKAQGATVRKYLVQLIQSALAYDTNIPGNPPNIDGGGVAYVKLPRQQLGGWPSTWAKYIPGFCALGLLCQHKPDNHSEANNTAAENYSVKVAKGKGHGSRAATWYTFPRYAPSRLAKAEAKLLENGGKMPTGKDAIRDAWGEETANRATDTRYPINPETVARRETLRKAALARLDAYGYFYPAEVIADALSASDAYTAAETAIEAAGDIFSVDGSAMKKARWIRNQYERTWREYRDALFKAENLRYHRPSGADREAYHLSNGEYIVTRRQ